METYKTKVYDIEFDSDGKPKITDKIIQIDTQIPKIIVDSIQEAITKIDGANIDLKSTPMMIDPATLNTVFTILGKDNDNWTVNYKITISKK